MAGMTFPEVYPEMSYTDFMNVITLLLLALALPAQAKNPAPSTPESVANGAKTYSRYCMSCHGKEGKGDGLAGARLEPKPSNLTDAEWKHGASDGEIFAVIHDGAKNTPMKAFGSRLTEKEIWDVVNYVRTLKM
jgi:mono/diheme cytochrome c family protein